MKIKKSKICLLGSSFIVMLRKSRCTHIFYQVYMLWL